MMRSWLFLALSALLVGCGQTRTSDTQRTATEQLLISDAVDRAVSEINFGPLQDQKVFLDTKALEGLVDRGYLESTLKQHMLASGLELQDSREKADFVVEARAGALGTGRQDVLYGIPSMNLPSISGLGVATVVPEIPFAKRTEQQGVAKVAVFAYEKASGKRVWQSGMTRVAANAKHLWVLGAGPYPSGTIYEGKGAVYVNRNLPNVKKRVLPETLPVAKLQVFNDFHHGSTSNSRLLAATEKQPSEHAGAMNSDVLATQEGRKDSKIDSTAMTPPTRLQNVVENAPSGIKSSKSPQVASSASGPPDSSRDGVNHRLPARPLHAWPAASSGESGNTVVIHSETVQSMAPMHDLPQAARLDGKRQSKESPPSPQAKTARASGLPNSSSHQPGSG